ncbi:hypothetical protein ED733_006801 [Metarhizium rileyi]|uniref:Cell wall protein n=1 Tax=Metarhizium rileyi (strain RCEF 4871) TaxID=1649241 RepID=A0A5C6GHV8_METRR|nr:hypothetical protein ED733_006801 [Metarhizium rileyi]
MSRSKRLQYHQRTSPTIFIQVNYTQLYPVTLPTSTSTGNSPLLTMKFPVLATLTLVSGAFAGVLVQRDLATIKSAMSSAGTGIDKLDAVVKAFSGDSGPLVAASEELVKTLKDGKASVDPTAELSLADALGLQAPAQELQTKGDALLADLKAQKDAIAKNNICEQTFQQASGINSASKDLINSVVSKVPESAQGIAQGIVAGLLKALQEAQDAFSPGTAATTSAVVVTSAQDTCPAAQTVTVTAVDSKDCTPTPTCTKKAPVTITTTKKTCPTKKAGLAE